MAARRAVASSHSASPKSAARRPTRLDLVIDDTDGAVALPPTGAKIHVWLGWKQGSDVTLGLVDKGWFIVDEVAHGGPPDLITIRARSADFTSDLKTRREKSWHGTTLGAIVTEIAQRHQLTPRCAASLADIAVTARRRTAKAISPSSAASAGSAARWRRSRAAC
ncbi:hypothetical protein QP162_13195 [Sphingomonas aurantiaca]|uniref:hypothetical protein n=1 Tax=Sphingomonas aurantiaca TaxID=185949 RepID=UPI002FDF6B9C